MNGIVGVGPNNPKMEIIRRQIDNIEFGFYHDSDVRARSVVEITSPVAWDPTQQTALPRGLYDPRLGPLSSSSIPCPTCALRAIHCPGHFGHIELSVPVYHPLRFLELLQLLRIKCYACHQLLAPPRQLLKYKVKFMLLWSHQIGRLQGLEDELAAAAGTNGVSGTTPSSASERQRMERDIAQAFDNLLHEIEAECHRREQANGNQPRRLTSHERKIHSQLCHELLAACKSCKRCQHCNAANPKIRQDSHNKLFQVRLSPTHRRWNRDEGIVLQSALVEDYANMNMNANANSNDGYNTDDTHERRSQAKENGEHEDNNSEDDDDAADKKKGDQYMHAQEVYAQAKRTWATQPYLLSFVFGSNSVSVEVPEEGHSIFFWQAVPVPPSRFRPAMHLNGMAVEHSQTQYLAQILRHHETVREAFTQGDERRAYAAWIELQTTVNCFVDSSKDPSATPAHLVAPGIKQILERKEGLFRKNLMGKRVDFACRSVISPDPYIGTNEIGLPRYFATVLTYPVPVTAANVRQLRQLVERGVEYPGARWVELPNGRRVELARMKPHQRQAVAAQLLQCKPGLKPATVGRQLIDGDYVLMNRQPTLHKPGIMAHRVRILHNPTQKTIRMHYANCNTYNADFDGDEMNCHFPQNDLAQAEARYIARTDLQYIAPTDGSPLRGLIQDHVVGGVKLTKRDSFFEKWECQQLLFASLVSLEGLEIIRSDAEIELVPPAVMKPRQLWTGKQIITTMLNHLRKGSDRDNEKTSNLPGLSADRKAKTPESAFGSANEEHLVLIRDGELLRGVLDKSAFGSTDFSLVHAAYEAYGPDKAGLLLNMLGRLFTAYIQYYSGHSCRMEDLILTKEADAKRRVLVEKAYNVGARAAKAWAESEGGKTKIPAISDDRPLKPYETAASAAKIGQLLAGKEGSTNFANLDGFMQGKLNPLSSDIVKTTLPDGLAVSFPENTFGLMTTTGAKGSIVNQSQVTCALGQQALEGRRVPRLSSGRTLPSFAPYDPNPRADGFVMDRFLTGIRPQEYYFHCMAGREGLVDTAVKTSRSGYLQRCLMKHLEELKICYDYTVRNSEGGVVQFLYGEDGLDPTKAAYLDCSKASFEYMARNKESLQRANPALPNSVIDIAASDASRHQSVSTGKAQEFVVGSIVEARKLQRGRDWRRGMLCVGWYEAVVKKLHSNGELDLKYADGSKAKRVPLRAGLGHCGGTIQAAESSLAELVRPAASDPILSTPARGHRLGVSGACVSERVAAATEHALESGLLQQMLPDEDARKSFGALIGSKYSSSLCPPGEAVGAIAAQSVGEPSTQMTLNTFHLAGSGANVTLGIPRLREIIMTASRSLLTPTMSVPLRSSVSDKQALRLTRDFTRLPLSELIASNRGVAVTEKLVQSDSGNWTRSYFVTLKLHNAERIIAAFGLGIHEIARVVASNFVPALSRKMKDELKRASVEGDEAVGMVQGGESSTYVSGDGRQPSKKKKESEMSDELDEDDPDDDNEARDEDGMDGARESQRRDEIVSYFDDEAEEVAEGDEDDSDDEAMEEDESGGETDSNTRGRQDTVKRTPQTLATTTTLVDEHQTGVKADVRSNTISLPPLAVDPSTRPLLMVDLVERAAQSILVRSRKNISEGYVNEEDEDARGRCFQTAGVNFDEIYQLNPSLVDHDRLLSNDIWKICCSYGVEAARNSIVQQIRSVFGAYGIEVDPRHLGLIADAMTWSGGYKAMNRIGMEETASTFLQMSFETTVHFLKKAASLRDADAMQSPSANICVGRPIRHGTGSFSLVAPS